MYNTASLVRENQGAIKASISATSKIKDICNPLFRTCDTNHFAYIKFMNDGKMLRLSTDEEWSEHYYKNFFHQNVDFYSRQFYSSDQNIMACLWDENEENKGSEIYSELQKYNYWNGVSIFVRQNNAVETFHFASPVNAQHMNEVYINNIDFLRRFIIYFKSETKAMEEKFTQSHLFKLPKVIHASNSNHTTLDSSVFHTKKYIFDCGKLPVLYVGRREFECIYLLAHGKSFKEISHMLNISVRTVETHISNLREKTGASSKGEMIDLFIRYNLTKWYSNNISEWIKT